jgi:hypothetical protein
MLVEKGDRILVNHRRLYDGDAERFFVGIVDAYDAGLARVSGYTWLHDITHGKLNRKEDKRCKIIPLASGNVISYVLPNHLSIDTLRIEQRKQHLLLTDGNNFIMDISDRLPPA